MVDTTHNIEMKLIEDSGSTKTDWILIDGSNNIVTTFSTKGLNPNILLSGAVNSTINTTLFYESKPLDVSLRYF